MSEEKIRERVLSMLEDILGVPLEELHDLAKFLQDLQADEMEPVEIAFALEEEFGFHLSDEDATKLATVGDLVAWVTEKNTARSPQDR